jgi:peptidoglycan hydrolase CwlO-like protein
MQVKEKILFLLPWVVIVLLLLSRGCAETKIDDISKASQLLSQATEKIKTLKLEKETLLAEVDELYDFNDSLAERAEKVKSKVANGKERIKILSETVVITDTLVIEYTDAMKGQIKDIETLVEVKDSTISNQEKIIVKKDSITANVEKTLGLTEEKLSITEGQLEESKKEHKKKDRRITVLKIERVLYPVATAAGFIFLMLSK